MMVPTNRLTKIPVVFYRSSLGGEPVRDWLRSLPPEDRREIGVDITTVQLGWPVGMPLCRALGGGLWEIRSSLPSHRIARILFCMYEGQLFVLHGFIKKTQKTPQDELALAQKRMKEVSA